MMNVSEPGSTGRKYKWKNVGARRPVDINEENEEEEKPLESRCGFPDSREQSLVK